MKKGIKVALLSVLAIGTITTISTVTSSQISNLTKDPIITNDATNGIVNSGNSSVVDNSTIIDNGVTNDTTSSNNSNSNFNQGFLSGNETKITDFDEVESFQVTRSVVNGETKYKVVIKSTSKMGNIAFIDSNGNKTDTIYAGPNDQVYLEIIPQEGFTVDKVRVYGDSPSIMLGVDHISDNYYSFKIPEPTVEIMGEIVPSGFQVTDSISVVTTFIQKQHGKWTFKYDENGMSSYVLSLTEDLILDDLIDGLKLDSIRHDDNTDFIIEMNGFNVSIGYFTVPSKCNLAFSNKTDKKVFVKPIEGRKVGLLNFSGVLTQWQRTIYCENIRTTNGDYINFVN